MKLIILPTCYVLIFYFNSFGQSQNWTVKAGEEAKEALPANVKFRYPEFMQGSVYFKNGTVSKALLDFNFLNQEMQFIDARQDTLSVDNEATISYVSINSDTFYYSKGYLEFVSGNPTAKIAKRQRLKVGDISRIGGYGQASSTSAITSVTSLYNRAGVADIKQRADVLLVKETIFYIGDQYNYFSVANKKNLIKMFGQKENAIEEFLKENKIRFNNVDDLKLVINFLQKAP